MLTAEICEAILRDHSRKPRHLGKCEEGCCDKTVNPACGDEVELSLCLNEAGTKIECLMFTGAGCAASQSAASLWVARLQNADVSQALEELSQFCRMIEEGEGNPEAEYESFGDAAALLVFARMPARQRCATLAPRLLIELINRHHQQKNA